MAELLSPQEGMGVLSPQACDGSDFPLQPAPPQPTSFFSSFQESMTLGAAELLLLSFPLFPQACAADGSAAAAVLGEVEPQPVVAGGDVQ